MQGYSQQSKGKFTPTELAANPLGLVGVLRKYGKREHRAICVYVPFPDLPDHADVRAWVEISQKRHGLVKGEVWEVPIDHVDDRLRESHPQLFIDSRVKGFHVYRIDEDVLTHFINAWR